MSLQLVIFDLAGTTVKYNQDVHRALQRALSDDDIHITLNEVNHVMGLPKPIAIEQLLLEKYRGKRSVNEKWIAEIHQRFRDYMIDFYTNDTTVSEKKGVSSLFYILKEHGILVGIDTGFDRAITQSLIDRLGWEKDDLIDISIASDEVPRGRPYPDMILKSMALTGVNNPAFVAKVGDTISDLQEGTRAGCKWVVGVTDGAFNRESLSKGPHTHLIGDIREMRTVLELE